MTDERLSSNLKNLNSVKLTKVLKKCKGYKKENILFFNTSSNPETSVISVSKKLDKLRLKKLNFCLLSLGEDGHLAGHFKSSKIFCDRRFVYTDKGPKPNPKRISFNVKWLKRCDNIVLCIQGEKKRKSFLNFLQEKGLHSNLKIKKELLILTDLTND